MKPTWLAASILCFAVTARAQDSRQEILLEKKREKAEELSSYEVSKLEARFLRLERVRFPRNILERGYRGIRPLVGGMPSGSGFVLGVGYLRDPDFGLFRLEGNARYSTRSFAELDAEMAFPSPRLGRKLHARVNTTYQDYTSLGFFGLGNDSSEDNRTFFGQKNKIFGGGVTAALSDSFELTGDVDRQRVEIEGGERDPSLETAFAPISVPGFTGINRDFNVFRTGATLRLLDKVIPSAGITLSGEAQLYDDRESSVFDFYRFVGEVKAYVPLGYRNRMLAMRLRTSHASADDSGRVPFYMMETLGGARTIRGFRRAGLTIFDKPSNSCLASRIPWGQRVTAERLVRIELSEKLVKQTINAKQVRVRDLDGIAKLEVASNELNLLNEKILKKISSKLQLFGFSSVIVDPEGYKPGKINMITE